MAHAPARWLKDAVTDRSRTLSAIDIGLTLLALVLLAGAAVYALFFR